MREKSFNNRLLSPAFQCTVERLLFEVQMEAFDEAKHLRAREKQYPNIHVCTPGLFVIRETAEGWWRESIEFKGDVDKQVEKLTSDPTVACGWISEHRFNEPGGWYDPS